MNILISIHGQIDPTLLELLLKFQDTSIFLSISDRDTQRIIHEAKPEILILDLASSRSNHLKKLVASLKEQPAIYYYEKKDAVPGNYILTRYPHFRKGDSNNPSLMNSSQELIPHHKHAIKQISNIRRLT